MLKRFENLGTALSRNESKKIVGGDETILMFDVPGIGGEEGGSCHIDTSCDSSEGVKGTCKDSVLGCYCSNGISSANACYY